MAKYEEKYIVLPLKYTEQLSEAGKDALRGICVTVQALRTKAKGGMPSSEKYYVCNQDEPYADHVLQTILNGETLKENMVDCDKEWSFETCKKCGCRNTVAWGVPNAIWETVVGKSQKTLCLGCFDELAQKSNVKYNDRLIIYGVLTWEDENDD